MCSTDIFFWCIFILFLNNVLINSKTQSCILSLTPDKMNVILLTALFTVALVHEGQGVFFNGNSLTCYMAPPPYNIQPCMVRGSNNAQLSLQTHPSEFNEGDLHWPAFLFWSHTFSLYIFEPASTTICEISMMLWKKHELCMTEMKKNTCPQDLNKETTMN